MKRNKKINEIVEKDLSVYNDTEFLSTLKNEVKQNKERTRQKSTFRKSVWALSITSVVVVSLVIAFVFGVLVNTRTKSRDISNNRLEEVNGFVQNIKFQNVDAKEVYVYENSNDVDKPVFNVTNEDVKIDIYRGNASLISENIYVEKTSAQGFDINTFEQTFFENNDEHISISGYIDTGKEILYFIYVKPLGNEDKDEFMKKENQNLVNILNNLIVVKK